MKPKVYATYPLSKQVKEFLAESCNLRMWTGEGRVPEEVLLKEIANVEGLYTSGSTAGRIDEALLIHAPDLKVVSNVSVGYNNFDIEAMREKNIVGTNTPYVLDETVADLDVFEQEPVDPTNLLLKMPNVVTVPHIGSATAKTEEAMAMRAAEKLVAVLNGQEPRDTGTK